MQKSEVEKRDFTTEGTEDKEKQEVETIIAETERRRRPDRVGASAGRRGETKRDSLLRSGGQAGITEALRV
jgi:hypothetical protein